MPFINVKVIEGVFDAEQKRDIIQRLTDTMVGIEGEAMRSVTWVTVEEVRSGSWGIGGQALTPRTCTTWLFSPSADRSRHPGGVAGSWPGGPSRPPHPCELVMRPDRGRLASKDGNPSQQPVLRPAHRPRVDPGLDDVGRDRLVGPAGDRGPHPADGGDGMARERR